MAVEEEEVLAVLQAVLSYLNITLPSQQLSPDAQMGRESLLNKVENLVDKINATKSSVNQGSDNVDGIVTAQPDVLENKIDEVDQRQRMSSYIDMTQFQANLQNPESMQEHKEHQENDALQQEDYEVSGVSEVTELLEEDEAEDEETYDDIANSIIHSNGTSKSSDELYSELTEDELLSKLKGFENISAKKMAEACTCSGWLMKQKKKLLGSKWHKRYCVLKDEFLFYYCQEEDSKALGVIVLPGRIISNEKSSSKDRFVFKLVPYGKGRSTYLFSVSSKDDYDKWDAALSPICSQKLSRLESKAFNRLASRISGDSDEGSAGEPIKPPATPVEEEMYEILPDEAHTTECQQKGIVTGEAGDDFYEGIPGEYFESEPASLDAAPIEEDIYDTIDPILMKNSSQAAFPPRPLQEPVPVSPNPVATPPLPPSLPPRGQQLDQKETLPPPLPPSIPKRDSPLPPVIPKRDSASKPTELIEEEPPEEEEEGPSEDAFSYDNVYIGTDNHTAAESDELEFKCGDLIYVLEKINPNWWIGCKEDKVGLVPSYLLMAGFAH
ncbi:uncharacterized protein LOC135692106 isoform X2 [Rhopilema esculentum]|uniref:uncharacterized protein LOC135692106 isoform X2 n=1 Tax=Rhopilema esculentum TaxID=499914 RepID=UPI0031D1DA48